MEPHFIVAKIKASPGKKDIISSVHVTITKFWVCNFVSEM